MAGRSFLFWDNQPSTSKSGLGLNKGIRWLRPTDAGCGDRIGGRNPHTKAAVGSCASGSGGWWAHGPAGLWCSACQAREQTTPMCSALSRLRAARLALVIGDHLEGTVWRGRMPSDECS